MDLSKFTDQELLNKWRESTQEARSFRAELEERGYAMQWRRRGSIGWASSGPRIKNQVPTEYRFIKTEVQILD